MARRNLSDRYEVAVRLHSAMIHVLRRLRRVDEATGMSPPKLSALSVLVFGGSRKLGELAAAEQVRPATMSRLVRELELEGLVTRRPDPSDGRAVLLHATSRARKLLREGRSRRATLLASWLEGLDPRQLRNIDAALESLEQLANPPP